MTKWWGVIFFDFDLSTETDVRIYGFGYELFIRISSEARNKVLVGGKVLIFVAIRNSYGYSLISFFLQPNLSSQKKPWSFLLRIILRPMTIKIAGQIMLQAAPEIYPKFFSKKTIPAIDKIKPKNIKF